MATKTSSRVGSTRSSDSTSDPGLVEGADDLAHVGGAALELDQHRCRPSPAAACRSLADHLLGALGVALGEPELEVGLADLGLERGRGVLGDDQAAR